MDMYETTANILVQRIAALIPDHPEILTTKSAWDLFKVPGFNCDDLAPTLMMAQLCLEKAQYDYRKALADEG